MPEPNSPTEPTRMTETVRELQAIFDDQARFDEAVDQLKIHGFDRAELSIPDATPHAAGATPEGGARNPDTPVDRQQIRTLAGSTAGITAAMIGAGVTIATGGAAALAAGVAIAAGAVAGGATHAATAVGTDVEHTTRDADASRASLVLSVTVRDAGQERLASETLRKAGALRVETVNRTDATIPRT